MFGGGKEALRPGRPVTAIVRKVTREFAFCSIPELGNREATLAIGDISTSQLSSCDERLQDGQRIEARCGGLARPPPRAVPSPEGRHVLGFARCMYMLRCFLNHILEPDISCCAVCRIKSVTPQDGSIAIWCHSDAMGELQYEQDLQAHDEYYEPRNQEAEEEEKRRARGTRVRSKSREYRDLRVPTCFGKHGCD